MFSAKLTLVLLLACVAFSEAAKFKKLTGVKPVPYCSTVEMLACVGEIETAWGDCFDAGDIFGCIEDILGASDCLALFVMSWDSWELISAKWTENLKNLKINFSVKNYSFS
ncbi:uncharacterized protein LOC111703010 [Eurytemora carolleeae]|uniref:uncharacterized protein LOC111703010 n=1 Tax=Eurytemora carolleeae TaxID=1294199 RepID=UPI000C755AD2|nr:uncharacterized protein LOC111703010 [Eurytemora carolleeae]|eukprot:XP_023330617.1 uncharacterized protein LOC111703010 [Eurytemora affinis]